MALIAGTQNSQTSDMDFGRSFESDGISTEDTCSFLDGLDTSSLVENENLQSIMSSYGSLISEDQETEEEKLLTNSRGELKSQDSLNTKLKAINCIEASKNTNSPNKSNAEDSFNIITKKLKSSNSESFITSNNDKASSSVIDKSGISIDTIFINQNQILYEDANQLNVSKNGIEEAGIIEKSNCTYEGFYLKETSKIKHPLNSSENSDFSTSEEDFLDPKINSEIENKNNLEKPVKNMISKKNLKNDQDKSSDDFGLNDKSMIELNRPVDEEKGFNFMNAENPPNCFMECGFVTGNNKKIVVDQAKLDKIKREMSFALFDGEINPRIPLDENADLSIKTSNSVIDSELLVQDKNSSVIDEMGDLGESESYSFDLKRESSSDAAAIDIENNSNKNTINGENITITEENTKNKFSISNESKSSCKKINKPILEMQYSGFTIEKGKMPRSGPIRRYNCPQVGHSTTKLKNSYKMVEIYKSICQKLKGCEKRWIFTQFKWTWLHFFISPVDNPEFLEEDILQVMKLRRDRERSILRRIVEYDDVPFRYMVLGLISFNENSVEVFDGYYSVRAEIDKSIYRMLVAKKAGLGMKLHIFGGKLLSSEPQSIFDIKGPILSFNYNGLKLNNEQCILGYRKAVAFANRISEIRMDGGIVSSLVARVSKVIETKYLVHVDCYRNVVDDIEQELEKISELADKVGRKIESEELKIRRYCRMMIEDESGSCLFTWWNPGEVKENDKLKMIYLVPVEKSIGLHLSTNNKSYIEKLT